MVVWNNFTNNNTNSYLNKIRSKIEAYNLNKIFSLNPATQNILEKYHKSSALILPSLYEDFQMLFPKLYLVVSLLS